jgi:hypothetical protein
MKFRCVVAMTLTIALVGLTVKEAQAVFIPIDPVNSPGAEFEATTDTPENLVFKLRGGPVNTDSFKNDFRPALNNWDINFDIALSAFLGQPGEPVDERVLLFGEVFHRRHPPAEGLDGTAGFVFTPTIIFSAANLGPINLSNLVLHPTEQPLPPGIFHLDDYSAVAACPNCGVGFIGGWDVTINGRHRIARLPIPEPPTVILLGIGVLTLLGFGRRKTLWCLSQQSVDKVQSKHDRHNILGHFPT